MGKHDFELCFNRNGPQLVDRGHLNDRTNSAAERATPHRDLKTDAQESPDNFRITISHLLDQHIPSSGKVCASILRSLLCGRSTPQIRVVHGKIGLHEEV